MRGIFARSAETDAFWCDGTPRCECSGECGLHLREDADGRCLEQHGEKALGFRGDVALEVVAGRGRGGPVALCQRCRARREAREETVSAGPTMVPLFGGGA